MKSRILSRQFLCFLLIFIFPAEMLFLINAVEKQVLISDENLNETGCSLFPIIGWVLHWLFHQFYDDAGLGGVNTERSVPVD